MENGRYANGKNGSQAAAKLMSAMVGKLPLPAI
jgi:hypothetical protein